MKVLFELRHSVKHSEILYFASIRAHLLFQLLIVAIFLHFQYDKRITKIADLQLCFGGFSKLYKNLNFLNSIFCNFEHPASINLTTKELSLCNKLKFSSPFIVPTKCRRP